MDFGSKLDGRVVEARWVGFDTDRCSSSELESSGPGAHWQYQFHLCHRRQCGSHSDSHITPPLSHTYYYQYLASSICTFRSILYLLASVRLRVSLEPTKLYAFLSHVKLRSWHISRFNVSILYSTTLSRFRLFITSTVHTPYDREISVRGLTQWWGVITPLKLIIFIWESKFIYPACV